MLLPCILIVWGTVPCLAIAAASPSDDHAMASSQPIPSVLPKPEGLTLSEYLHKRLQSQPQNNVHQRHTLLTARELAMDFNNWSKDSDESASRARETLLAPASSTTPALPVNEIPSTTIAPHPPTPKKPLSHAIYSSSLDAIAINKNSQTSGSRNVFSRRRYTETPFHLGRDSNKWTPVRSSGTVKTSRNRGETKRNQDFSFEGGGGGLSPRMVNENSAYTQTDSFRQKDTSTEPELQRFGYGEVTKRRSRLTSTSKPSSRYSKRNKQNRNRDPHHRNSEIFESSDETFGFSPSFESVGPPGHIPHASPELRWPDGSLVDEKSKSEFAKNPHSFLHQSPAKENNDYNNYSFLGSPEVVGYYHNKEKDGIKYTHKPSTKIPFSFEVDAPISKELPKYTYITRGERKPKNDHSEETQYLDKSKENQRKFREEDSNSSNGKSREDGPYRYKTSFTAKSRENEKYRRTTTESPNHSYVKNSKSNEETSKSVENKRYDTPLYRPKTNIRTNHYRFRLGKKSSDTPKHDESDTHKHDVSANSDKEDGAFYSPENIWSSEKTKARHDEPSKKTPNRYRGRTTTEKYYFEPSPSQSNEEHPSSKSRSESSKEFHNLEEVGFPFDGYIIDDHYPKGHKSHERDSVSYKDSSKSPEREFQPSYRYESQEMNIKEEPSKEKPSQKSRPRSKWNETHKWSREPSSQSKETTTQPKRSKSRSRGSNDRSRDPSSQSKETTTQPKRSKNRSRGSNDRSRDSSKHSRESLKRSRVPASHRSKERKTTVEIIDEYAVHHIAGPPYHDSIPVDVVKTLEKDGGPSYIPKTANKQQDVDSYEVAVDKFLDDDDTLFHFEEHSYNDPPHRETPIVYYEQDAHSGRQSTEMSLETPPHKPIDIKTSSHFGDVFDDTPTKPRNKPSKAGRDRTRILDELVYEYEDKHSPHVDHHQNHRYNPESVIGSNDPFNFDKNIGRAITYFERRDPVSQRDSNKGIAHHNAQEPRMEDIISHENHYEGITRHDPFGHQDAIKGVSHDSSRFQHDDRFSQGDPMEGVPRQRQSDINYHDPFHYEGHSDDISTHHEPDLRQQDFLRPRNKNEGRVQILDHIDVNTPPNFYKNSLKYPMDPHSEPPKVKHSSFHSLPVDEPNYDFSREPRFQVSYERSPPGPSRGSRRRLPATPQPQKTMDRRVKPDFDFDRNLREEPRYRSPHPNRSKTPASHSRGPTPHSRGSRDRGHPRDRVSANGPTRDRITSNGLRDRILGNGLRDRIPSNGPRDRIPSNGPRDRISSSGPRDRRSRNRSRDEVQTKGRDGRSQGPSEQPWNFQDLVTLNFPSNIGQLFG